MSRFRSLLALAVTVLTVGTLSARAADPVVVLNTTLGNITIQLNPAKAPVSTANFLAYVDAKFYDGTIFHRVIPGFVAQGGGFTANMNEKETRPPIKNEAGNGLTNDRGTISMARTSDPASATSQFFLNLKDNASLNPGGVDPTGYAVFGKIIGGLDVLDKIAHVETAQSGLFSDVPVQPVVIVSARRK